MGSGIEMQCPYSVISTKYLIVEQLIPMAIVSIKCYDDGCSSQTITASLALTLEHQNYMYIIQQSITI
jgi:hypothetical protein